MAPAPWDNQDVLFVLVTGANSGVGFGICQRLIDEFLASHSLSSHLVLVPTTRTAAKSRDTIAALKEHSKRLAETSAALRSRAGPGYDPKSTTRRIHILSVQLDLCSLPSIRQAARQLVDGPISSPSTNDDGWFEPLADGVRVSRLDAVIFNAGIGGWTGLNWPRVAHHILTRGITEATTWPTFKAAAAGLTVNPLPGLKIEEDVHESDDPPPVLGEVFCANVFGHYTFAHGLVPLLNRRDPTAAPGRVIWLSSIEAAWEHLDLADFQAVKTRAAYESTKRLTDVLALTADLPAVRPYSSAYLGEASTSATVPPKIYLAHPGVVVTTIFPLNAFLFFWYRVVLYLARLLGSPWHPVTAYKGACAPVWLALCEQYALDAAGAERVKWGSSADRRGREAPKKTEVEGWGWEGRVEDRAALARAAASDGDSDSKDDGGVLAKLVGRKRGAPDLTEERRVEFEALGVQCWREMEKLRGEWEARMDRIVAAEKKD